MKRNLFLMTVALCFMLVLFPAAVSAAVTPTGTGVTPVSGDVEGTETFTFPFSSDNGDLDELELDFYFGTNTGEDRDYTGSVGINLPADSALLNIVLGFVNSQFNSATSESDLITAFGGGAKGLAALKLYEAAGFKVGEDMSATVADNIQYTGTATAGTWTLNLNTYLLDTDTMEILAAVKNANGDKWGENNYTIADGANTQAFLYNLAGSKITTTGVTPANNTTVDGIKTFSFPFSSTYGNLKELELDFYFGDNTGNQRDYVDSVGINLPADSDDLNDILEGVNDVFENATSESDLITAFGGGTQGQCALNLYKAAGFRMGQDRAAAVKNNIQYTGTATDGIWTLKLNTYLLDTDTMEILTAITNDKGAKWGENNYSLNNGADTQAFLYTLTQDKDVPEFTGITINSAGDGFMAPDGFFYCEQGLTVNSIKVHVSEAVTLNSPAIVTMQGILGECAEKISNPVTYGTITLDPSDTTNKTLIITPSSGNNVAGYLGSMVFTIAGGAVSDSAENTNALTSFRMTVGKTFTDIAKSDWYFPAVTALSSTGIALGVTEHSFAPNQTITRAQFLVMLMRACNIDAEKSWTNNFSDAGSDEYYSGYLAAAKKLGIAQGIGDNKFAPNQNISRQEMFTLLYRILDKTDRLIDVASPDDLSGFADSASIADYALTAIKTLVSLDVVQGSDNHMLLPTATATRAEAAQIIFNALYMINAQG